jgi:hypothetical protein
MRHALVVLLAYGAWILASAGSVLDLVWFRAALNQIALRFHLEQYAYRFLDRASLFVLGGLCLFLIVLGEGYFHDGAQRGDLKRRAIKVLGVEAVLAAVLILIPWLLRVS